MNRDDAQLTAVFGASSRGSTLAERAGTSDLMFVRSQMQLAVATPRATGRELNAREVLDAFGFEALVDVAADLRPRFEALGYVFVRSPRPDDLPAFMSGWIPDAIAIRGPRHVAIEVAVHNLPDGEHPSGIRSRFAGRQDWRLSIVGGAEDATAHPPIPTSAIERIRKTEAAIEGLVESDHVPAALLMAFALLETTLRVTAGERTVIAREPGTVVQALAMEGLIDRRTDAELRQLIPARDRVAHGSWGGQIDPASIRSILAAVEIALATAFAA